MLRTLIIDDEQNSRDVLRSYIQDFCAGITIAGEADSIKTGLVAILKLKPELVLLDIELSDGNSFQLLEQVKEINFNIIFVTAYDHYAVKAFRFSASDYLLKPVNPDELIKAVQKVQANVTRGSSREQLSVLLERIKNPSGASRKIILSNQEHIHIVNITDIIRCEAMDNYTMFHLRGKQKILVTRTLKEFDELLQEFSFLRIHKSHLVNFNAITRFDKTEGGSVIMEDASEIPVPQRKREQLVQLLDQLRLK